MLAAAFIIVNNKIKAVKRNSKYLAKSREKPVAARLHERGAEAAFELWMESVPQVHSNGHSAVIWSSVCESIFQVPYECGIFIPNLGGNTDSSSP